jgi:hypothetical protein
MRADDRHPTGLLADFAEGSLTARDAQRVARHLAGCDDCVLEIERWQDLYTGLARLPRPAVSPALRDRILEAVAREGAPAPARGFSPSLRRRAVAAFSWAYAAGVALVGSFVVSLAFVPSVRDAAGTGLARLTASGLSAGLSIVDLLSYIHKATAFCLRFVNERLEWLGPLGRAVETVGGAAEIRLASLTLLLVSAVLFSVFFVRFLHQRDAKQEVRHVGPLLA